MDGFIDRFAVVEILIDIGISAVSVVISINKNEPDAENQFDGEQKRQALQGQIAIAE